MNGPPRCPTFVRATPSDLEVALSFVRAYYLFDRIPFDEPSVRRGLLPLLEDDALGGVWFVVDEGEPVGYFDLSFGYDLELGGRQATVTELYLRPDRRRRGFGTATLQYVERLLAERGIGGLELQVERTNAAARAFYERQGFEAHDRIPLSKRVSARTGDASP
jgi:ribosomal protein S18 acetylase RimI-like enzyme